MPELKVVTFKTRSVEYEFALSWDDEALMDGAVSFEMTAASWPVGQPNRREPVTASVSIERDEDDRAVVVVKIGDWEAPRLLLAELYGDTWVEEVMEAVPAWALPIDPVTACFLRSGVSVSLGQIVECKNQSGNYAGFWEHARAIGRCLRENVVGMGMKMAFRCGRCVAGL